MHFERLTEAEMPPLITINTLRLEEMIGFYQRIGMLPMHEINPVEGFASLSGKGVHILLQNACEGSEAVRNQTSFKCSNLDEMAAELLGNGISSEIFKNETGLELRFRDPDRNVMTFEVEFAETN